MLFVCRVSVKSTFNFLSLGYGMTETSPVVTTSDSGPKSGSSGIVLPSTAVKVNIRYGTSLYFHFRKFYILY